MPRISLSPKFIKEVIMLFRERPLKEILFGKHIGMSTEEKEVMAWIKEHPREFQESGGRSGQWNKIDPIHKGAGHVYLLPNRLGKTEFESIILLEDDTKITNGPDLWVYLSSNMDVKKDGLGEYLVVRLIKGNTGGQSYVINIPVSELKKYNSAVIWCKQFSALFTFAPLS